MSHLHILPEISFVQWGHLFYNWPVCLQPGTIVLNTVDENSFLMTKSYKLETTEAFPTGKAGFKMIFEN